MDIWHLVLIIKQLLLRKSAAAPASVYIPPPAKHEMIDYKSVSLICRYMFISYLLYPKIAKLNISFICQFSYPNIREFNYEENSLR
jgi:hypothetical protein